MIPVELPSRREVTSRDVHMNLTLPPAPTSEMLPGKHM